MTIPTFDARDLSFGLETLQQPVPRLPLDPPVNRKVLVVDDDRVTRELLRALLERESYDVRLAESGEAALSCLRTERFAVVLSDIHMFGMDGLELLRHLKREGGEALVILMTGFGSLDGAVAANRAGAFDYLSKPLNPDELKRLVSRARSQWESRRAHDDDRQGPPSLPSARHLIGKSPRMVQVYRTLAKAAQTPSNILIVGESGTGKEVVAQAIHENSPRVSKPFVTMNCGALAETLLESELFGHVKGSFTGAIANKRGLFEEADGGTIFLDEIGDISPALQVKLLRVIQEGEFKPVGSAESRRVDARVIAATHRDLDAFVAEGRFREDLYYRLKVIRIELPPLRCRVEDVPELIRYFLARQSIRSGKRVSRVSKEAMALLCSYPWPGNIRELEHAIERAFAMTSTNVLYPEDFPPEIAGFRPKEGVASEAYAAAPVPAAPVPEAPKSLEQMERTHIVHILREVNFNKSRAADILGIDRATLYRKAQRYGIRLAEEKAT